MKKYLDSINKHWIISTIVGIVLLTFGIIMAINGSAEIANSSGKLIVNFTKVASGLVLLVFIFLVIGPLIEKNLPKKRTSSSTAEITTTTRKTWRMIVYIIEATALVAIALFGFILPGFGLFVNSLGSKGLLFWFGIIFYIHGAITLLMALFATKKQIPWYYILGMILVTVGVILFMNNYAIDDILEKIIIYGLFIGLGSVALLIGVFGTINFFQTKKKKKKDA